jgi:hypothetical protein
MPLRGRSYPIKGLGKTSHPLGRGWRRDAIEGEGDAIEGCQNGARHAITVNAIEGERDATEG